ncbi:ABC transporter ATP-binding protein [Clostridiaceae bacterium M8S5]|nr:ABC transporter ATP-binding protein [Clostridiaceae bacterium M8S5]
MLEAKGLMIGYESKIVVEDFSIDVKKGEILSIIGPNGSGKSTILKSIARIIKPENGVVYLSGDNITKISQKEIAKILAVVSQQNTSPADFTVRDLVYYGRMPHKKWYEKKNKNDQEVVDWALGKTKLLHMSSRKVITLSGGERQRAWIAMALAQKPKILLLDEPTTYLDICHQLEVLELVRELNEDLMLTCIMVLHDLNQASKYSHRICVLKEGKIYKVGLPQNIMTKQTIRDVYNVDVQVRQEEVTGKPHIIPLGIAGR